jgi:hypothetical protein
VGDRLAEIKHRRAKANPAGWRYNNGQVNGTRWPDDTTFIVCAAEDISWLVAELEALRSALGDLEDLATTVAISAAATAELARMVRTNQIRAEVP